MRSSSERVSISAVMLSINAIYQGFHLSCSRLIDKSESINFLIETDREDFTCKYLDDASNTTYGIGECIYSFSTCFPPNEPVSGLTFNYSATLTTGIITVLNVNKSLHGTVYCYKTYNVLINASLELPVECTTQNNGTSSNNTSKSKLAVILGSILGGACVVILIIIAIACRCCRREYEADYPANTLLTMEQIEKKSSKMQGDACYLGLRF
ncbi:uncharacterized protein LOC127867313 isoform X5 [Dreissena polymorpha]|uniref:Uncharacterized protein n=1 Tax=Dreissena polymorpha TaxID=45954 RepID=A0A9D4RHH3_DREPO|nr:uncharacterized protein LOC127867313 isoform X5 [Dreissena polymorpha]KAH3866475.1 hypothetical protein DPMN_029539 [Dreissena polymorpha]